MPRTMFCFLKCSSFSKCFFKVIVILLFFYICDAFSGEYEPGGKPETEIVNPGAEVMLGALVNIRKRGAGLFGCGERRTDGVTSAEALKWATDELNRRIWSSTSSNISIGLEIMDSCSRTRIATSQLTQFLPELAGDVVSKNKSSFPYKFGIIDDVGLENELDVSNTLEELNIPVMKTDVNINSQQEIVTAVFYIIRELHWDHVSVVHSNSRYSLSMLKTFTKSLKKFSLCVPWIINIENSVTENDYDDLETVLKSGIPIVSLLSSEKQDLLLMNLKNVPKHKHRIPLLFTDFIVRDHLKKVPNSDIQVFALVPLPEKEDNFESHFWKNSKLMGLRQEDELELMQRTRILRKMQAIMKKFSEVLRNLMKDLCQNESHVCPNVLSIEGRNSAFDQLSDVDWSVEYQSYGLMEYHFRNPEGHILLHKMLAYNKFRTVDVFESNLPFLDVDCDNDSKLYKPECNCLEAKSIRRGSARNIVDRNRKEISSKKVMSNEPATVSAPISNKIDHFSGIPTAFSSFRNPVNAILACLILLGSFFTLFTGQYFATFAALPNGGLTSGTSIIGYVILIGLFFLYVTNLTFILTPSVVICTIRRFGISTSYAIIFSGMMIKVWTVWKQAKYEKVETAKPSTLIILSLSFSGLQLLFSGLWLILVPPEIHFDSDQWICYPSGDLDSHLLVSMIYVIGILLTTAILAIQASAKNNISETRSILVSSALVAVLFSCWGVAIATGVWQYQRTAVMNLVSATILLCCLYIPKMRAHSKLKKSEHSVHQHSLKLVEEFPVIPTLPPYPLVIDHNLEPPTISSEDVSDSTYSNQAYSMDDGTESISLPFEIDNSSNFDIEQEPVSCTSFFDEVPTMAEADNFVDVDPTQVVPSTLYPLDMFNNELFEEKDHYEPGTNEFTPQHRISSQLYLYPPPEWVP